MEKGGTGSLGTPAITNGDKGSGYPSSFPFVRSAAAPVKRYLMHQDGHYYGEPMSKRAAEMIFSAMYTLTDLRMILRQTAPSHQMDARQREEAQRLIDNL